MSFIKAVEDQWDKGLFAHEIERALKQDPEAVSLFGGATSITTVANLISALAYREGDKPQGEKPLTDELMLNILFDCFRLLAVKQIEHDNLSQAEHLIIELAKRLAARELGETLTPELRRVQLQMLHLGGLLDQVYRQRRSQKRNMGR